MSELTRPLTDEQLAAAGIEPAPIAREAFVQVFAVDRGELTVVDEAPYATFDDPEVLDADTPPSGTWYALMVAGVFSVATGVVIGIQALGS